MTAEYFKFETGEHIVQYYLRHTLYAQESDLCVTKDGKAALHAVLLKHYNSYETRWKLGKSEYYWAGYVLIPGKELLMRAHELPTPGNYIKTSWERYVMYGFDLMQHDQLIPVAEVLDMAEKLYEDMLVKLGADRTFVNMPPLSPEAFVPNGAQIEAENIRRFFDK